LDLNFGANCEGYFARLKWGSPDVSCVIDVALAIAGQIGQGVEIALELPGRARTRFPIDRFQL